MLYNSAKLINNFGKKLHLINSEILPDGELPSVESGMLQINSLIDSNMPFAVSRLENIEAQVFLTFQASTLKARIDKIKFALKRGVLPYYTDESRRTISINAGIFPATDESLNKYSNLIFESLKNMDLMGYWSFINNELFVLNSYAANAQLIRPRSLEPYYSPNVAWTNKLKGKRVLIIHPFAESIQKQYSKRELIFPKENILPDFELITIKAAQTSGGGSFSFDNWYDAYAYMCNEIDKVEFDVAIIGAGGYGLPLASYIKTVGKQAIHMGGATQLLFGIRGRRWDNHEEISQLINENWIRPAENERPVGFDSIENGCYW